MRQSRWIRVAMLVLLLGALFGLMVWRGSLEPDPAVWALPGPEQLGTDYGRYLGDRVAVWGQVVRTDPVVIRAQYGVDRVIRLQLVGLDDSLQVTEGMRLNVYGVVEPDNTIRALNVVRIPAWGVTYTLSISFLAGLWVLGRIVRHWTVDTRDWTLRRRSAPLRIRSWLRTRFSGVTEDA